MSDVARNNLAKPVWEGLLGEDAEGAFLIGGSCAACGFITLGVRDTCPECWARGKMKMVPLGRRGTIYTCTVIHQGPDGYDTPFAVGYVDIEQGVRVFSHLSQKPTSPKPGMQVRLTAAPLRRDKDGASLIGPLYVME